MLTLISPTVFYTEIMFISVLLKLEMIILIEDINALLHLQVDTLSLISHKYLTKNNVLNTESTKTTKNMFGKNFRKFFIALVSIVFTIWTCFVTCYLQIIL